MAEVHVWKPTPIEVTDSSRSPRCLRLPSTFPLPTRSEVAAVLVWSSSQLSGKSLRTPADVVEQCEEIQPTVTSLYKYGLFYYYYGINLSYIATF
ncbi:uncharacterized protein DS421_17g576840 [Arachis hypogaea]|nr:uncharacterized protein DS421_17g576840 [Arachis hypogaea]